MVTTKHCCYGTCNSDSRYADRPSIAGIFFIRFPKPKTKGEMCDRWARACGRVGFDRTKVNQNTFICSKHFVGGNGPTAEHPDPIPAQFVPAQVERFSKKRPPPTPRSEPVSKKQRLEAATSLLELSTSSIVADDDDADFPFDPDDQQQSCSPFKDQDPHIDVGTAHVDTQTDVVTDKTEQGTQTVYDKYMLAAKIETMVMKNAQAVQNSAAQEAVKSESARPTPILSLESMKNDDKKMKFFTGLIFTHFMALFHFLGDAVNNLSYIRSSDESSSKTGPKSQDKTGEKPGPKRKTSKVEELFLTLVRLRRGFSVYALSHFMQLSESQVRVIFTTWLQFLYCHFRDIRHFMFPERAHFRSFMPRAFYSFKNIRVVIDCTEFFVQMPRDFARQGNLYSSYKSHHTFKCLIGVAPNGSAVYVSDLFEGAISDKELFERCGMLDQLNPRDLVLADRGFTIKESLMQRQVDLNIPPFLMGRDKLTPQEELLTRRIAKARIHVERFNERLKKFRLIGRTIPLSLAPLANQAVFVACCLVNFQGELVKSN